MTKGNIITMIILIIVFNGLYFGYNAINRIESNMKELMETPLQKIDLANKEDGIYQGSFRLFPVAAEVAVTIRNNVIIGIDLIKHNHGRGGDAEIILDWVVKEQTLEVDIVSGATFSSMILLKAIEDALL